MKKKTIINILIVIIFVLSISSIVVSALLLTGINNAPDLLTNISKPGGFPTYLSQHTLVEKWGNMCQVILIISCILAVATAVCFVIINFFISDSEKQKKTAAKKIKRIAALEKELNELKKDGE